MKLSSSATGLGRTSAARRYANGKISSKDYLREVKKEASQAVEKTLRKPKGS